MRLDGLIAPVPHWAENAVSSRQFTELAAASRFGVRRFPCGSFPVPLMVELFTRGPIRWMAGHQHG